VGLEPVLAGLVALVGIALTSFGAVTHTATAMAPGAALAFIGGGWLGNSLARRRPFERSE
jgi:membrane protein DedA with SNARE-associated domain